MCYYWKTAPTLDGYGVVPFNGINYDPAPDWLGLEYTAQIKRTSRWETWYWAVESSDGMHWIEGQANTKEKVIENYKEVSRHIPWMPSEFTVNNAPFPREKRGL